MLLHLPRGKGYGTVPRVKNGPALAGYGAEAVRDAIASTIITLPEHLRQSLTWDRGKEMAQHARCASAQASRSISPTRTVRSSQWIGDGGPACGAEAAGRRRTRCVTA
jgi:hypothetical protein